MTPSTPHPKPTTFTGTCAAKGHPGATYRKDATGIHLVKCGACQPSSVVASKPVAKDRAGQQHEDAFASQLRDAGYVVMDFGTWIDRACDETLDTSVTVVSQFEWGKVLAPPRKFKSDFAHPYSRSLIEVNGKAHDMRRDYDTIRRQLGESARFRFVDVLPRQVHNGTAIELVKASLSPSRSSRGDVNNGGGA